MWMAAKSFGMDMLLKRRRRLQEVGDETLAFVFLVQHGDLRELALLDDILAMNGVSVPGIDTLGGAELMLTSKPRLVVGRNIYDATIPPFPDTPPPL